MLKQKPQQKRQSFKRQQESRTISEIRLINSPWVENVVNWLVIKNLLKTRKNVRFILTKTYIWESICKAIDRPDREIISSNENDIFLKEN